MAVLIVAATLTACSESDSNACSGVDPGSSVARSFNELTLAAIRRDFPAPTVHSRNLFHVSVAMWDAWAAFDDEARGYIVDTVARSARADDRDRAIAHAAYTVLVERYRLAVGGADTLDELEALMSTLCLDVRNTDTAGDGPVALGNRIGAEVLAATLDDGSHEATGYVDLSYFPANDPMVVKEPGTSMIDPNRWQPLAFDVAITQNGQELPSTVQEFVGPHWGRVDGFALPESDDGLPLDPGPPPMLDDPTTDAEFKASVVEVIAYSSLLDPTTARTVDIGPASIGGNTLGTQDGRGYGINPVSGMPYEPNIVNEGDFGRVLAEFWADGPDSETPPGHWNTLANAVTDSLAAPEDGSPARLLFGGTGEPLDRLEWDVKLYFALNGALHDAAVAAWGAKRFYDYVRPISMVRHMGGLGQSSDPGRDSFHPSGLPLEPGLIELVTTDSAATGERHEALADHLGAVVVQTWSGNPEDPEADTGGVGWILATDWVPYQKPTFVTPAFAAYVSGHSAFSRAAAEVLTSMTGSEYFPGGLGSWTIPPDSLEFEAGPDDPVTLQWATYHDAADQAGLSRLYGGIHVRADDFVGRIIGSTCGTEAWKLALTYF